MNLIVCLFIVVVLLFCNFYYLNNNYNLNKEKLDEKSTLSIEFSVIAFGDYIWNLDMAATNSFGSTMYQDKEVWQV